ncbi:PAS domain S-box-containing protein [Formivibrio citricus]|uniref:histidine kinase n=1 Tax=Formivibrio citricus TaxID=83765 RepID=A0A1I5A5D4_9NEIS|nr:PAS domain S-box protein [Formivibrio citricus]SFN57598.1 PAS domain S-box-containing protein [Formivibrio citricus]
MIRFIKNLVFRPHHKKAARQLELDGPTTFSHLIDRVRLHNEKLERKVQARTQALHTALDQVQENEALLRLLFDHSPLGFAIADSDCHLIRVNAAFCNMLGYSEDELLGKTFQELSHPADREAGEYFSQKLLGTTLREYHLEKRYCRKNGSTLWAKLTAAKICDDNSETKYIAAIIEDISDQKKAEQQQNQRIMEQRSALVREVNHRIKNNIQQTVGLLLRRLGPYANQNPALGTIVEEVIAQLECIASVHGLQAGQTENRCSLNLLLSEILVLAKRRLHAEAPQVLLDLRIDMARDFFLAEEESAPLALIINELLANAIKHCRREQGSIEFFVRGGQNAIAIRIENERSGSTPIVHGTGLELAHALLPRKGAKLDIIARGNKTIADLTITNPVIK